MKVTVLAVLALLVVSPQALVQESSPGPAAFGEDEYLLFSDLINSYLGGDFEIIVINSRTESWCINDQIIRLKKKWTSLKNETLDSLIIRNQKTVPVEKRFDLSSNYTLLSYKSFTEILADSLDPDWNNFDREFPDSPGFLTLSRAGFDKGRTQALVIFCNAYRCSGTRMMPGARNIAYFLKKKGKWVLEGIEKGFRTNGYEE